MGVVLPSRSSSQGGHEGVTRGSQGAHKGVARELVHLHLVGVKEHALHNVHHHCKNGGRTELFSGENGLLRAP
eukprot:598031-Prorocentrum_minimum.AAC.1